ncbi:MAG: hypothetical protein MZW92_20595 [Comamonadaceae bacterium]|nr:hypothetical protein [Comamonadaceae bacterium]
MRPDELQPQRAPHRPGAGRRRPRRGRTHSCRRGAQRARRHQRSCRSPPSAHVSAQQRPTPTCVPEVKARFVHGASASPPPTSRC